MSSNLGDIIREKIARVEALESKIIFPNAKKTNDLFVFKEKSPTGRISSEVAYTQALTYMYALNSEYFEKHFNVKESTMVTLPTLNLEVLRREAGQGNDELSKLLDQAPTSVISDRLTKALAEEREAQLDAFTVQARMLLNLVQVNKESLVNRVRELRRSEKEILAKLDRIDKAVAYGLESNNLFPMAYQVGKVGYEDGNLHLVPEGWKPQEATAAAKTKK